MSEKFKKLLIFLALIGMLAFAGSAYAEFPSSIIMWNSELTADEKIEYLKGCIESMGDVISYGIDGRLNRLEERIEELERRHKGDRY